MHIHIYKYTLLKFNHIIIIHIIFVIKRTIRVDTIKFLCMPPNLECELWVEHVIPHVDCWMPHHDTEPHTYWNRKLKCSVIMTFEHFFIFVSLLSFKCHFFHFTQKWKFATKKPIRRNQTHAATKNASFFLLNFIFVLCHNKFIQSRFSVFRKTKLNFEYKHI